jgi:hypothetical protein
LSKYEELGLEAGYEEAPKLMLFLVPVIGWLHGYP